MKHRRCTHTVGTDCNSPVTLSPTTVEPRHAGCSAANCSCDSTIAHEVTLEHMSTAGASSTQLRRLQSVLNAAARLICSAGKCESVTGLLRQLHWPKVPERINFRLCVLMHHCLHEGEPAYLAESVRHTSSRDIRRHAWSNDTVTLLVTPTRRSTLGGRAFPVAAWNALPARVRCEPSLRIFRRKLKTYLFHVSFPEQSK